MQEEDFLGRKNINERPMEKRKRKKSKFRLLPHFLLLLSLVLISILTLKLRSANKISSNSSTSLTNGSVASKESDKEYQETLKSLLSIYEISADEKPQMATVNDKSKLANNEFYKNSENGDKLLLFTKSQKAILFRPSTKKIINVVPLILDSDTSTKSDSKSSN